MGVAEPSAFSNPVEYELPVFGSHGNSVGKGSIANGLGLPAGLNLGSGDIGDDINMLPFAGFARIWNDWFRDESLQESNPLPEVVYNMASGDKITDAQVAAGLTGFLFTTAGTSAFNSVNKYKDLFTTCLPAPQKGPAVTIPLGTTAPVYLGSNKNNACNVYASRIVASDAPTDGGTQVIPYLETALLMSAGSKTALRASLGSSEGAKTQLVAASGSAYADLTDASAATIDLLRKSIAMQTYFERLARGGSRYVELLRSTFGVAPEDATLQRPNWSVISISA